jgi:MSHA biogenesis protein MshM
VTHGTPRLANIIAHKALMLAFAEGRQQVQARHVRKAAADTPESHTDWMLWVWGVGSATVIAALAIFAFSLR